MVGAWTANASASRSSVMPALAARLRSGLCSPWRHINCANDTAGMIATAKSSVGSMLAHSAVV